MKRYGIIMAGGGGTRFWPLSREEMPKQFLNLTGKDIMVNETIDRLDGVIKKEDVFVVTNVMQADLTFSLTGGRLERDHILAEPAARNTAACIGYAAMEILKKYGDGVMCIFPSDHYIRDGEEFRRVLTEAARAAEETGKLVTIGIKPEFPSTGYGYILQKEAGDRGYCEVEEFVEKPDLPTAEAYLADGGYLWNSGMFIWKASVIMECFQKLLPDIYSCLEEIGQAMGTEREKAVIERVYPEIPKISVDYGIMERSKGVLVLKGDFGWNDVGSWDTLQALYDADEQGNTVHGESVRIDAKNCISYSQGRLIAMLGVEDLIVVETEKAVLVCAKERAQEVKKIVENLQDDGKIQYL